jgi:hypothetical protein
MVINSSFRQGLLKPLMKLATVHLQQAIHGYAVDLVRVVFEESVIRSGSLAKYRTFFGTSRSSSFRRTWGARPKNLALNFDRLSRLFPGFISVHGLNPSVPAVTRGSQSSRYSGYGITPLQHLPYPFVFEFRGDNVGCS